MIDVINLKKSFGDTEVLKGIDVTVNKGDIVVVLGPSGSGRTEHNYKVLSSGA